MWGRIGPLWCHPFPGAQVTSISSLLVYSYSSSSPPSPSPDSTAEDSSELRRCIKVFPRMTGGLMGSPKIKFDKIINVLHMHVIPSCLLFQHESSEFLRPGIMDRCKAAGDVMKLCTMKRLKLV